MAKLSAIEEMMLLQTSTDNLIRSMTAALSASARAQNDPMRRQFAGSAQRYSKLLGKIPPANLIPNNADF